MTVTSLREALEQLEACELGDISVNVRVLLASPLEGHGYIVEADVLRVERSEFIDGPDEHRFVIESAPVRPITVGPSV